MATMKQRLHRKNSSNVYDTIHLESSSDLILRPSGSAVETSLGSLPIVQTVAGDPTNMMPAGQMMVGTAGAIYVGCSDKIAVFEGNSVYRWNRYNSVTTITYIWNRFRTTSTLYHFWDRFNVISEWELVRTGGSSFSFDDWAPSDFPASYCGQRASADSDGTIRISNTVRVTSESDLKRYYQRYRYWTYGQNKTSGLSYIEYVSSITSGGRVTIQDYESELTTSKGSANGEVRSTSDTAYPQDGISGDYWYTYDREETVQEKGSAYGTVSSTSRGAYPNDGIQGSYWYTYNRQSVSYSQGSYIDQVSSIDPNTYPTNGRHTDGYWYVKI